MSNRVLLINPPDPDHKVWIREGRCQQWDIWGAPFPPFSLAMISTQLVRAGYETRIIDSGPERKGIREVIEEIGSFGSDMAILTTTSPTIETDLNWFAGQLKKVLPGIIIAAVGIHVSALPLEVLARFGSIDFVIIGEPEIVAKELVTATMNGKSVESVKGIAYRDEHGVIRVNSYAGFVDDIDSLGFPDWAKISFSNYLLPITKRPFSMISFSRGCPFSCKYCATHVYSGRRLRKRSVKSLVDEIRLNLSFGVKDFLFWTELMTGDHSYLNAFLDEIVRENLHKEIRWVCNSRVDGINSDLAFKMKKAGCWQIAFGFEFGDDDILKRAQKGGNATISQSRIAAETAHRAGIAVDGHFILGYPGETVRTMQKTIDFACSLPLTFAHFYAAVPFPGSTLYSEAMENGWNQTDNWGALTQDNASLKTDSLGPQTIDRYIAKAYRTFYTSPKVFARIYRIPRSLKEYIEVTRMGVRFYRSFWE